jgi:hypothetical protein
MAMISLHPARNVTAILATVMLAMLAGCASEPEMTPTPAPPVEAEPVMAQPAPVVRLRPDYPQSYTVVKGDTLWDISSRFLKDPWMWPELWQVNPQINNPHLIYPGDVLTLYFVDGKPMMKVERPTTKQQPGPKQDLPRSGFPVVKYSPQVREVSLDSAVPTIPLDRIRQYLSRPQVITEDELEAMPYVVSYTDERLLGGGGNTFYARGINAGNQAAEYVLLRTGQEYVDPDTDEVLGYEGVYLGDVRLKKMGDPATLVITRSTREIMRGDRLVPKTANVLPFNYMPRPPTKPIKGKIISVVDGVANIGQYQVVVLNLGRQEDIEPGYVLAVMQAGAEVDDTVDGGDVQLPDLQAGTLMVFRVFERVSYGLIVNAERAIHTLDTVTNP